MLSCYPHAELSSGLRPVDHLGILSRRSADYFNRTSEQQRYASAPLGRLIFVSLHSEALYRSARIRTRRQSPPRNARDDTCAGAKAAQNANRLKRFSSRVSTISARPDASASRMRWSNSRLPDMRSGPCRCRDASMTEPSQVQGPATTVSQRDRTAGSSSWIPQPRSRYVLCLYREDSRRRSRAIRPRLGYRGLGYHWVLSTKLWWRFPADIGCLCEEPRGLHARTAHQ